MRNEHWIQGERKIKDKWRKGEVEFNLRNGVKMDEGVDSGEMLGGWRWEGELMRGGVS